MKALSFIILLFFTFSYSFWELLKWWDCSRLDEIKKIISNKELFPDKIYQTAFNNLSKFCNWQKNVLNSKFYINHLIDVKFRYLDWFESNSDPDAKAWRQFLNQIAKDDFKNIKKSELISKYKAYRWIHGKIYWNYINFCNNLYWINNVVEPTYLKNYKANIIWSYLGKCYKLANKRKLQETILVQSILYKIHYQTIQARLFKIVNQDFLKKWDKLYNKFVISLWDFMYLVRRFIKSTDANTK